MCQEGQTRSRILYLRQLGPFAWGGVRNATQVIHSLRLRQIIVGRQVILGVKFAFHCITSSIAASQEFNTHQNAAGVYFKARSRIRRNSLSFSSVRLTVQNLVAHR